MVPFGENEMTELAKHVYRLYLFSKYGHWKENKKEKKPKKAKLMALELWS